MRDKLLFGTIGLLVGVVVMQWTMPSGNATVVTPPVGNIVAMHGGWSVLTTNGELWDHNGPSWRKIGDISPVPVANVQFIVSNSLVDKSGNLWSDPGDGTGWVNVGQVQYVHVEGLDAAAEKLAAYVESGPQVASRPIVALGEKRGNE